MWLKYISLFITLHVLNITCAGVMRPRRDLVQITKFLTRILGINNENLVRTIPLIENYDRIYEIPKNEEVFIQTLPDENVNRNYNGKLYTHTRYPEETHAALYNHGYIDEQQLFSGRKIETKPSSYTVTNKNYLFTRPTITNQYELNSYEQLIPPYYLYNDGTSKSYVIEETDIGSEGTHPPLQPPLYIQNRIRQIFRHAIPPVVEINEPSDIPRGQIILPTQNHQEVNVYKYPFQRISNDAKDTVKVQQFTTPSEIFYERRNQYQPVDLTNKEISEALSRDILKTHAASNKTKGSITFSEPVRSRYTYKQIYHSDPSKNTAVIMDNTLSLTTGAPKVKEASTLQSLRGTTDYTRVPPNYIYVPPVGTDNPLPAAPTGNRSNIKRNSNPDMSPNEDGNISLKGKPIASPEETLRNNKMRRAGTKARIVKRIKLKSPLPENTRGDIPES